MRDVADGVVQVVVDEPEQAVDDVDHSVVHRHVGHDDASLRTLVAHFH